MTFSPRNPEAAAVVRELELAPHPEGGWYKETYRSAQTVQSPKHGERAAFTSILFLLEAPDVSRLHRLDAEELWNWHAGSPLDVHVLTNERGRESRRLGASPGQTFQTVIPADCWFGAEVPAPGQWSLVGCVVAPGFEFRTFELADRAKLLAELPLESEVILRLTRSSG
jgi:predicted cupin superfamily sugar epimerase